MQKTVPEGSAGTSHLTPQACRCLISRRLCSCAHVKSIARCQGRAYVGPCVEIARVSARILCILCGRSVKGVVSLQCTFPALSSAQ